ncbi:hypothetical protein [Ligilactobacillus agilis]|uniref:hypothetical protein n=1 Tax=Ligilactobacillus agilis TaxID=1601 RepID=UPI00191F9B4B|nr:hypothetical protein [Ligilactobacillus agilis]
MHYRYEDTKLVMEVINDLEEFGPELGVIAIYSVFPEEPNVDFITDYLWDEPNIDDYGHDLEEYEAAMADYQKSLETLKERKFKRMTIYELAKTLKKQAEIF